ncbi:hypothetical protein EXU48_07725 [Occultella glacieicola]|uniref:Rhamnan synthesis protein F n=1 Tax=Occultella glacieicola TaxID=2518684 RepID=A0ABY2E696_9MICO|nr:rhamnan synthesis F family protein [Occultella glacieicola]TDE96113.1 hypothetical protein EXU48_07725 [Occultella glacieicola]
MGLFSAKRPRVLAGPGGEVRLDPGASEVLAAAKKVAIVAQYSPDGRVCRSLTEYLREFVEHGYTCLVISTAPHDAELFWSMPPPVGVAVARRRNLGYDFGSWSVGLDTFPHLAGLDHVVLTNDSMVGPFASIGPLIADYEATGADVWTMTDSWQIGHHFQSYFVGFRRGILAEAPLRDFFRGIRVEATKMDVVRRYELGLSRACVSAGYALTCRFRSHDLTPDAVNPTLAAWRPLLLSGLPFVKRTLITDPSTGPDTDTIVDVVRATYGEEIDEWL